MTDANATSPADDYESGLLNRRRVLGDAWVDRSLANRNGFNAEFQELITRHAWNDIWGRPALGDKTRRFKRVWRQDAGSTALCKLMLQCL